MTDPEQTPGFPPPHRLCWNRPNGSPLKLLYLCWGHRFYGQKSSPFIGSNAWFYTVILRGNPILTLASGKVTLGARDIVLVAPGCVYSMGDREDRRSDVLGWKWDTPPACASCTPPRQGFLRWKASAEVLHQLGQIHAACRKEVFTPDEFMALSLGQLRIALDVMLARSRRMQSSSPQRENPCDLAIRWMQEHLQVVNPVHHICDYLQVSPSTLRRIFLEHVKQPPAAYFQRLKMERAWDLLQQMTVKEAAYCLGYHYPNDFSKAYKDHFGTNPTALLTRSPGRAARRRAPKTP